LSQFPGRTVRGTEVSPYQSHPPSRSLCCHGPVQPRRSETTTPTRLGPWQRNDRDGGWDCYCDTSVPRTVRPGNWDKAPFHPHLHAIPSYRDERNYAEQDHGYGQRGQPSWSPTMPTYGAPTGAPSGREYTYQGAKSTVDRHTYPSPVPLRVHRGVPVQTCSALSERTTHRKVQRNLWSDDLEPGTYRAVHTSGAPLTDHLGTLIEILMST
jgi:hypothetical protein